MLQKLRITSCHLILILILLACNEQSKVKISNQKPNIVFILADDLGLHDLSSTGSSYYETPHIDRLARNGTIFTRGYAASRVCSPSRASILTGKFTARHGITDWIGAKTGLAWREHKRHNKLLPATYKEHLPFQDRTLAETLKSAGYTTFFAGKWHLGGQGSYPEDHGFDLNVGGWEVGSPIGGYFSPWENPKLENKEPGENLTIRLAKETASFIAAKHKEPFFAFLSFYAVHAPIQTTREKWSKYRDKAVKNGVAKSGFKMERVLPIRLEQDNPVYAGLVETMDEAVGLVLETLHNSGLEDNTIVIFTSDNGGVSSGDSFSTSNLPLRGGKGYQWEGGLREPFIIKVPGLSKPGSSSDFPVTGTDFYPTLLELAGLDMLPQQHVDGMSLVPILRGDTITSSRPLYWHYPHYGNQGGEPSSIIQEDGWKLIHYWEDNRSELYELNSDPAEQRDLAITFPRLASQMEQKLLQWLQDVSAQKPVNDPNYDATLAGKREQHISEELWPSLERERLRLLSEDYCPDEDWWGSLKARK